MSAKNAIDTRLAISHVRRGGALSMAIRVALVLGVVAGFLLISADRVMGGSALMGVVLAAAFMLAGRSVRTQQQVGRASLLIGAGQYDEAERTLAAGLESFIFYRNPRLGMLQNLAALRHAQRRFREAAMLVAELLRYNRADPSVQRTLRLMQAECALEMNELQTVHQALSDIVPPLPVRETLKLLELQIEYCVRVGAYAQAMDQLPMKIELIELLPTDAAARVQALLAISARRLSREDWALWLRRRVELLTDIPTLLAARPGLRELWD